MSIIFTIQPYTTNNYMNHEAPRMVDDRRRDAGDLNGMGDRGREISILLGINYFAPELQKVNYIKICPIAFGIFVYIWDLALFLKEYHYKDKYSTNT